MRFRKNKPPRIAGLVIGDLILSALAISIIVFSVYRPVPVSALFAKASPTPTGTAVVTPAPTDLLPTPTPTMAPTATPSPATGDFSDAFSKAQLADGMDFVYRSDDYLIGIEECYVGDAVLFVADIYIRDIHLLKTAFAFNSFKGAYPRNEDVMQLCTENNAMFAVTGDFVSIRDDGLVIRNGEILQKNQYNSICVLYLDGTMAVYNLHDISRDELTSGNVWQTWCFGPDLLDDNGQAMDIKHNLMRENPRCAIGYYSPGHYCFVVVDGRQKYYSVGMTLTQLSSYMAQLDCKVAYNLDGGQTAQMVLDDGLVNMPAYGGRKVGDIIYIERTANGE